MADFLKLADANPVEMARVIGSTDYPRAITGFTACAASTSFTMYCNPYDTLPVQAGANFISKLRSSQGSKWAEPYSEETFEKQLSKEPGTGQYDRNPDLKGKCLPLRVPSRYPLTANLAQTFDRFMTVSVSDWCGGYVQTNREHVYAS